MNILDWIKQKSQRELAAGAKMYNAVARPVKRYFAPVPQTRFRDVIREIPNTIIRKPIQLGNKVGNYGLNVALGKRNILPYASYTPKFSQAPRMNTAKGAYNFGAGIVNSVGRQGIINPLNDLVDNAVRAAYKQPTRNYNELQSGAAKIGYDIAGQGGRNFQNVAADVGQTVMPILDAWGMSKGLNILQQGYKQALKLGDKKLAAKLFKEYAKKSSQEAGRIGLGSGLASGAQEGRDKDLLSSIAGTAKSGLLGYLGGRTLGYGLPYLGRGVGRIVSDTRAKLNPNVTKVVKANVDGEALTLPELENRLLKIDKENYSGQRSIEEIKKWAQDIWSKTEKRVFEAVEPFQPESMWFRGAQKLDDKGVRPGMTIKESNPLIQEARKAPVDSKIQVPVYHSTDFEGKLKGGTQFTTDKSLFRGRGKNQIEAYVDIKNPYIKKTPGEVVDYNELRKQGYDGVMNRTGKIVIPFEDNQIKIVGSKAGIEPATSPYRKGGDALPTELQTSNKILPENKTNVKSQPLQEGGIIKGGVKTAEQIDRNAPQSAVSAIESENLPPETLKTQQPKTPTQTKDYPRTQNPEISSKPTSYTPSTSTDTELLQTLNKALKEAKPVRGQQEALYTQARAQKMAKMMSARGKMAGEKGFFKEKGALAGSLPKVEYENIRKNFSQENVDRLFNMVKENPNIDEWDKIAAQEGLAKILGESGMGVPTRNEIAKMHQVFGKEFTETLLNKRPMFEKLKEWGMQVYNLPRSMMAGMGDFSATLMQNALFAYRHPVMTAKNFGQSLKYFGSENFFKASMNEIGQRPNYKLMKDAKVAFTDVSPIPTQREEEFMSSLAEKIPGIGKVIKASGRAYTGFLNKMRADVADSLIETKKLLGDQIDDRFLKSMGEFVNMGTGRGSLGKLEKSANVLAQGLFSARKLMATFNSLNPNFYIKADPLIRKEALKTMGAFFGGAATITGLAKLAGADVSTDPTNSDFGKIKIGNTRINLFGTYQQLAVLMARQFKGYATSSTTGRRMVLNEGYKPLNRLELAGRFFESKEHPTLSMISGALEGQNAIGEKFDVATEGLRRMMPMLIADSYDLYKEHGSKGLLGIIPAMLGLPTQTYGSQIPNIEKTESGNPTLKLKNVPDISQMIMNKIRGTQTSNVPENMQQGLVEQKRREQDLDYQREQIKKGQMDEVDLQDPEIQQYMKKLEDDKFREDFKNSDDNFSIHNGKAYIKDEYGDVKAIKGAEGLDDKDAQELEELEKWGSPISEQTLQAYAFDKALTNLSPEEKKQRVRELKYTDKSLYDRFENIRYYKQGFPNISGITTYNVNNGERAMFIRTKALQIQDVEKRKKFIYMIEQKGYLSKKVRIQLRQLSQTKANPYYK